MKNFPSSLIKQKSTKQILGNSASDTLKNIGSKTLKNIFSSGNSGSDLSIDGLNSNLNNGYETLDVEHEIDSLNINKYDKPISTQNLGTDIDKLMYRDNSKVSLIHNINNGNSSIDGVYFEDPFLFSSSIFGVINNYKYIMKSTVPSILEYPKKVGNENKMAILHNVVSPSLFNPYNGVSCMGITEHVPLLLSNANINDTTIDNGLGNEFPGSDKSNFNTAMLNLKTTLTSNMQQNEDISDCSIKKLVEESNKKDSKLGLATYRYADFMFCKDLGKISNNHLITLRKFPGPIGDNIFNGANPNNGKNLFSAYPDVGRLVTWFGTEDNKLEDICRFNYKATWKAFTADIQQQGSEQRDEGILDNIANSFNAENNKLISQGFSSNTGLLKWGAGLIDIPIIGNDRMNQAAYGWDLLRNYDQNKIYTPLNTIWDTHKYEGKLEFNQEITLTFKYVLRSYSNINPKSAFLDLLGNIMLVTYRRGSFWGGETKIYGPQANNSIYDTANVWIDKGFDALGGVWNKFANGQFTMAGIQGWLSGVMKDGKEMFQNMQNGVQKFVAGDEETRKEVKSAVTEKAKKLTETAQKFGWTDALKGMLKNQLGRPAIYAFNSLLTGEPVGPWHLTIGNPRNPIMSMGNMIVENSEIQQSGPLGIDDFPSEIKLVVHLKHGRPRDAVEIEKMYTRGVSSIYKPMNMMELTKYANNPYAFGDTINLLNNIDDNATTTYNEPVYDAKGNPVYKKDKKGNVLRDRNNQEIQQTREEKIKFKDEVLAKILRNI